MPVSDRPTSRPEGQNYSTFKWFENGVQIPDATPEELALDAAWFAAPNLGAEALSAATAEISEIILPLPADADEREAYEYVLAAHRSENETALSRGWKEKMPFSRIAIRLQLANRVTPQQVEQAMVIFEREQMYAASGVSDEPVSRERDHMERAAGSDS